MKHLIDTGKSQYKSKSEISIYEVLNDMEFNEAVELDMVGLSHLVESGRSFATGLMKDVDHSNIDMDKMWKTLKKWDDKTTLNSKGKSITKNKVVDKNYSHDYKLINGKLHYDTSSNYIKIKWDDKTDLTNLNFTELDHDENWRLVKKYRKRDENFLSTQMIILDIDEKMTIRGAVEKSQQANLPIALLYPTFSHRTKRNDKGELIDKLRIVYQLPYKIVDIPTFKKVLSAFFSTFNGATDAQVSSAVNLIHGTSHKCLIVKDEAVISEKVLMDMLTKNKNDTYTIEDGTLKYNVIEFIKSKRIATSVNKTTAKKEKNILEHKHDGTMNIVDLKKLYRKIWNLHPFLTRFLKCEVQESETHDKILGVGFMFNEIGMNMNAFYTFAYANRDDYDWETELEDILSRGYSSFGGSNALLEAMGHLDATEHNLDFIKNDFWKNRILGLDTYSSIEVKGKYIKSIKEHLPELSELSEMETLLNDYDQIKVLIIADTGMGKTFTILEEFKTPDTIFILPNTANVHQIQKEYSHHNPQCFFEDSEDVFYDIDKGVVVSTWDSSIRVRPDFIKYAFMDEVHTIVEGSSYRRKAIVKMNNNLKYARMIIHVTATPDLLDLESYDKIIEFKSKRKTLEPKIRVTYVPHFDRFVKQELSKNSKKKNTVSMALKQNKKFLSNISDSLLLTDDVDSTYLEAQGKWDNVIYKDIVNTSLVNVKILLHTNFFSNGLNILNEAHFKLYVDNIRDVMIIKQYIARFRNALSIEVIVCLKDNPEEMIRRFQNFKYIRNDYEYRIMQNLFYYAEENAHLKKIFKEELSIKEAIVIDPDTHALKMCDVALDAIAYNTYIHQFKQLSMEALLKNYFSDVKRVKIGENHNKIEDNHVKQSHVSLRKDVVELLKEDYLLKNVSKYTRKMFKLNREKGLTHIENIIYLIINENKTVQKILEYVNMKKEIVKVYENIYETQSFQLISELTRLSNRFKKHQNRDGGITRRMLTREIDSIKTNLGLTQSSNSIVKTFEGMFRLEETGEKEGKAKLYNVKTWTSGSIVEKIVDSKVFKNVAEDLGIIVTSEIINNILNKTYNGQ